MQIAYYFSATIRAALVAGILAIQAYYLFTLGVKEGFVKALMIQCGLQIAAGVVGPAGFRLYAAAAAGWVSGLVAVAVAFCWVTGIIPISLLIGFMRFGEYEMLLNLVGLTVYLAVPVAIAYGAMLLDEATA